MHTRSTVVGLVVVASVAAAPAVESQIQAYGYAASMAGDDGPRDHYGISVGLTESWAIAGADWDDQVGSGAGAAYVMERVLDGSWVINLKLLPDESGYFGCSMAAAGGVVVVGSRTEDAGGVGTSGAAYVYENEVGLGWVEVDKLTAADPGTGDEFGISVATDGELIVVGTPHHYHQGSPDSVGAAYLWQRDIDGNWVYVKELLPDDGEQGDYFGWSVAVNGDTVAVHGPGPRLPASSGRSCAGRQPRAHRGRTTPGSDRRRR